MAELARLVWRPMRVAVRGPRRLMAALDSSEASQSAGGATMRRLLGLLFIAYATLLGTKALLGGALPGVAHILMAMFGVALFANVAGRFIRDWTVVLAGVFAYVLAGRYAQGLNMPIYYTPQIDVDRVIGLGNVPSEWLQSHLYRGRTGPLEVFAVAMYVSHFLAPLVLGFYIWLRKLGAAFKELMFGILATSVMADIVFVLFPTAPPWLAAQHGALSNVHHILKQSLLDLHVTGMASLIGDSHAYNIVAALPSMHAAFPTIGLIVAVRYGLPRWVVTLQAAQLLGVCFSIVYLGDHYVIDALAGIAFAWVGATIAHRLLARSLPLPRFDVASAGSETPTLATPGRS